MGASPFPRVPMSPVVTRNEQALMDRALDKTNGVFTQMCQESPRALFALTDLWRLWADPATPADAFEACFDDLVENRWMGSTDLLDIALDLQRPNALIALKNHIDFSTLGDNGFHLLESDPKEDNIHLNSDQGWVTRALVNREADSMDLVTMAQVSGQPTVWCDSLPMVGHQVTWLELALATGQWKTAEALWALECAKGPFDNQAYARLALAWMAGLVEHHRSSTSWMVSQDDERGQGLLTWWDRLLPTTYLMTEEVEVKPVWAHRVMRGTVKGRPTHEDLPPPSTVRPLDMVLEVMALVRQGAWVQDALAQRLRAVDWSTVGVDGWGRLPAEAAFGKHVVASEARGGNNSALGVLWPYLLCDMPAEQQDQWWKQAFGILLEDAAPLAGAASVFKGRYGLADTRVLADTVSQRVADQADRRSVSYELRQDQAALCKNLINQVLPPLMACCNQEAKAIWKGYREKLVHALRDAEPSAGLSSPEWRGLELVLRLPLVSAPSQPKARF